MAKGFTHLDTSALTIVSFCDPAGGKQRIAKSRCQSAIITIGMDHLSHIFVLEAWGDRCSTDTLIDRIFSTFHTWHPRTFGIEANAMQSLFADAVYREADSLGIRLPILKYDQPTNITKEWRIRSSLQTVIANGRLFLQESQIELHEQIKHFPMSFVVDQIDALASAIAIMPRRLITRRKDQDAEATLQYLRRTGAPAKVIEAKAALLYNATPVYHSELDFDPESCYTPYM